MYRLTSMIQEIVHARTAAPRALSPLDLVSCAVCGERAERLAQCGTRFVCDAELCLVTALRATGVALGVSADAIEAALPAAIAAIRAELDARRR